MRKIIVALTLLVVSDACFSQDTLTNTVRKKDTVQLYYKKQPAWGVPFIKSNKLLFKVGDSLYNAGKVQQIMKNNQPASVSFNSYRFNRTASQVVFYLWAGSAFATFDALARHKSVAFPISAFVSTYLFQELFFQKSKRQLRKALLLYNAD